jgi:3-phosphoshikimate 1-carboxyvinyltransferase
VSETQRASLTLDPIAKPVSGRIRPPGSKSIGNRALVCAALADGTSTLSGLLDSEDSRVMVDALKALGIPIEVDWPAAQAIVHGQAGRIPATQADLYIANSGTTVRFLAAMVSGGSGTYRLDGTPRMRERPIGDLLEALATWGVKAESEAGTGCPPVRIETEGIQGGRVQVAGNISSQYLSGLLMAAPLARTPAEIAVRGRLVSVPYVEMTLRVMKSFGCSVDVISTQDGVPAAFQIPIRTYAACDYAIEPDASAASYFWAAAAITGGEVTVEGLGRDSLQGDVDFVDALAAMGCDVRTDGTSLTVTGRPLRGITIDMNAISDTVMTLAAVALFAAGPTSIVNVGHIRHKETDRLAALATELRKLGATVDEYQDGLTITPGKLHAASIATYDDHRMAMSLGLVGLQVQGVEILDPGCTRKTYPRFFQDLSTLAETGWH